MRPRAEREPSGHHVRACRGSDLDRVPASRAAAAVDLDPAPTRAAASHAHARLPELGRRAPGDGVRDSAGRSPGAANRLARVTTGLSTPAFVEWTLGALAVCVAVSLGVLLFRKATGQPLDAQVVALLPRTRSEHLAFAG